MNEHMPKYKDLYKILQKVDWMPEMITEEDGFFTWKEKIIYQRAIKNGYINIGQHEYCSLKEDFKKEVKFDEEYWEITLKWEQVPMGRYNFDCELIINITNNWRIFLDNYSHKLNKIEYLAKEYPFLIPTLAWFLWWIIASILLYFIIWK
jgi:hypothetical protein